MCYEVTRQREWAKRSLVFGKMHFWERASALYRHARAVLPLLILSGHDNLHRNLLPTVPFCSCVTMHASGSPIRTDFLLTCMSAPTLSSRAYRSQFCTYSLCS
jgi:hypothetical protein